MFMSKQEPTFSLPMSRFSTRYDECQILENHKWNSQWSSHAKQAANVGGQVKFPPGRELWRKLWAHHLQFVLEYEIPSPKVEFNKQ